MYGIQKGERSCLAYRYVGADRNVVLYSHVGPGHWTCWNSIFVAYLVELGSMNGSTASAVRVNVKEFYVSLQTTPICECLS